MHRRKANKLHVGLEPQVQDPKQTSKINYFFVFFKVIEHSTTKTDDLKCAVK